MNKLRNITAGIIIAILLLFMLSIGIRIVTRNVFIDRLGIDNEFTKLVFFDQQSLANSKIIEVDVNWAELYPFENDTESTEIDNSSEQNDNPIVKAYSKIGSVKEKILGVEDKFKSYTTEFLVGYSFFVDQANRYKSNIKWNLVRSTEYNNATYLDDGYMTSFSPEVDVSDNVNSVNKFAQWLTERNIDFLYVQAPQKVYKEDAAYGTLDLGNQNVDNLLKGFQPSVHFLDLREPLAQATDSYHEAFFITDHHWKPETGLWAAGKTVQYLNSEMGYNLNENLFLQNQYDTVIYKDSFVGSHAVKIGEGVCKPEDFPFLFPKYETKLTYEVISDYHTVDTGDFSITYSTIPDFNSDATQRINYGTYAHSDCAYMCYTNDLNKTGKRCLILGDSYKCVYTPFLSQAFFSTTVLDLRYFNGSLKSFIESGNYDLVIDICNPSALGAPESPDHLNLFDFR